MSRFTTVPSVALAAVASVALTACGGGDDPQAASSDSRRQFQEAALKHAECMRRNGVDVPDPKPNGGVVFDPGEVPRETLERAERKCRKHLDDLPAPELSEKEQREFRRRALAHARCMRENGIDMPDPTFGPNGTVSVELNDDIPLDDPRFQAAEKRCREKSGLGGAVGGGPGG